MTLLALTFDDGPSQWTVDVLEVLVRHDARATFFVIGKWVDMWKAIVRATAAAGCVVGNHTYTHIPSGYLTGIPDEEIADELERTNASIEAAMGERPVFFRAPAFQRDERVLRVVEAAGLVDVGATVDPQDWRADVDADAIVDHVLAAAEPGAIVDLHDGYPPYWGQARRDCTPTVDAVRRLVPELQGRGYELVTVPELLAATG